ncbi:MAG: YdeI/OmpD-associated family protein [Anaerolineales bacterium]
MKQPIPKTKLLQAGTRSQWRAWLKRNHKSKSEIWLVYYKKHTGKPRVAYNDAVEEALCFGWIDSTVRTLDVDRFAQRFSVRNPKSRYSQANIERLRALARQGKLLQEVLATLPDLAEDAFGVPPDILAAVQANSVAWKNFQAFSPSYVRIRLAYIQGSRKRPAEFKKRLAHFIKLTEQNKQFGFGGIDKYY